MAFVCGVCVCVCGCGVCVCVWVWCGCVGCVCTHVCMCRWMQAFIWFIRESSLYPYTYVQLAHSLSVLHCARPKHPQFSVYIFQCIHLIHCFFHHLRQEWRHTWGFFAQSVAPYKKDCQWFVVVELFRRTVLIIHTQVDPLNTVSSCEKGKFYPPDYVHWLIVDDTFTSWNPTYVDFLSAGFRRHGQCTR